MTVMTTYIPDTDHAELTALLEKRRRLEIRRLRAKRLPSRSRLTLAEKLEIDRKFKAEMDELNRQIDEILKRTGGSL